MGKLVCLLATALILSSCAKNESVNSPEVPQPTGSREFKIEGTKSALKIELFGVFMGTPDYEAVWSVIQEADDQGVIDSITQIAVMIEGGVFHCIEVSNPSDRSELIEELKKAPTSLAESHYTVESVDDCSL